MLNTPQNSRGSRDSDSSQPARHVHSSVPYSGRAPLSASAASPPAGGPAAPPCYAHPESRARNEHKVWGCGALKTT
eukprot:6212875-Pleurochrysis_carterae.AAC.2